MTDKMKIPGRLEEAIRIAEMEAEGDIYIETTNRKDSILVKIWLVDPYGTSLDIIWGEDKCAINTNTNKGDIGSIWYHSRKDNSSGIGWYSFTHTEAISTIYKVGYEKRFNVGYEL